MWIILFVVWLNGILNWIATMNGKSKKRRWQNCHWIWSTTTKDIDSLRYHFIIFYFILFMLHYLFCYVVILCVCLFVMFICFCFCFCFMLCVCCVCCVCLFVIVMFYSACFVILVLVLLFCLFCLLICLCLCFCFVMCLFCYMFVLFFIFYFLCWFVCLLIRFCFNVVLIDISYCDALYPQSLLSGRHRAPCKWIYTIAKIAIYCMRLCRINVINLINYLIIYFDWKN